MKISLFIHFLYYLFFENHPKCLKNVHLIQSLSAGERDPLPLRNTNNHHQYVLTESYGIEICVGVYPFFLEGGLTLFEELRLIFTKLITSGLRRGSADPNLESFQDKVKTHYMKQIK